MSPIARTINKYTNSYHIDGSENMWKRSIIYESRKSRTCIFTRVVSFILALLAFSLPRALQNTPQHTENTPKHSENLGILRNIPGILRNIPEYSRNPPTYSENFTECPGALWNTPEIREHAGALREHSETLRNTLEHFEDSRTLRKTQPRSFGTLADQDPSKTLDHWLYYGLPSRKTTPTKA